VHAALTIPLPVREAVADLLGDLLGRQVAVQRVESGLSVSSPGPLSVANFCYDGGRLAAVGLADRAFGAYSSAALAQLPPDLATQAAGSGLDDDLREFLYEVLDVLSRLLNSSSTPHVVLRDVRETPREQLMGDTRALLAYPAGRQHYLVDVDGYGAGKLSLLTW
jgi:hypothetical protein